MANTNHELFEAHWQAEARRQQDWPVRLVAAIVFLNGCFAIFEVLYSRLSVRLENLLPLDYDYYGRYFGLFAGILLIYFSGRLAARKELAWWIAFIGSGLIVIDHGLFAREASALLLPSASLVLLAVYKDEFTVRSEPTNIVQGLRLLVLSLAVALAYGTIGFAKLLPRDFRPPQNISLTQGMVRTVREYTLIGNDDLRPRTREARFFLNSLDVVGTVSIALAFYSLFRPLAYRFGTLPAERAKARELLERYGNSSEDVFKLWPEDKSYYFGGINGFIAYRVELGVAVALGEPVAPADERSVLVREFREYCRRHGWQVAFVYIPVGNLALFEHAGLRPLKVGEDAIVETAQFESEVVRNKHFRAVNNKFKRLGYEFVVSEPPHAQPVLNDAASVTRAWLKSDGRVERGFGLGYHEHDYLQRSKLYLVYDSGQRLVAFANAIRSYNPAQETIDLMRYVPGTETGVMDWLFAGIIGEVAARGIAEFSLGLAPLVGVGQGEEPTPEERALGGLARLGGRAFSYGGLRRFKDKFEPRWEERYLVYERGPVGLALTAAAVREAMKRR